MNTNIKIEEVRNLLKSGDIAWAEAASQGLLVAEADNFQTRMLQGRFSAMAIRRLAPSQKRRSAFASRNRSGSSRR